VIGDLAYLKQNRCKGEELWRLNRYLAGCGVGSRRASEKLVEAGRVVVNGAIVRDLASYVNPEKDVVFVDGKQINLSTKKSLILNKPRDYLCTVKDPQGRRTIYSLLPDFGFRLFSVGRLDRYSEGLIILTNDGEFANAISHPRGRIIKQYLVWLDEPITDDMRETILKKGITSDGEILKVLSVKKTDTPDRCYEVSLSEGKNRHLRRLFEAIGCDVKRLKRIAIGSLQLKNLKVGQWRWLTNCEISALYREAISGREANLNERA
jgi:23S rRNA pseudouridine2605 synthase